MSSLFLHGTLAKAKSNFAGIINNAYAVSTYSPHVMPDIGDLDFRLETRVSFLNSVYGSFVIGNSIFGNSTDNLESFCLFFRYGEVIAYVVTKSRDKGLFRPINTAAEGAIGQWLQVGYERIGDTIYGLVSGQRVWAEQVGTFTIAPLSLINISWRGGGGGGDSTQQLLDWLTLDIGTGPGGKLERWLDFQFNEADYAQPQCRGKLGNPLGSYSGGYFPHVKL